MSKIILKKNSTDYPLLTMPNHYPADRVYLDGDTTKTVQDKCARKADLTNLDLTGTTNTTGSTIASGTYFYLNGVLVRAKTAIANGATFTLDTNYKLIPNGALNEIDGKGSVRVVGDGVKTHKQILNEIFSSIDLNKIGNTTAFRRGYTTARNIFQLYYIASDGISFVRPLQSGGIQRYNINSNSEYFENGVDKSSIAGGNGEVFEIIY